jgi:hypothetical protein
MNEMTVLREFRSTAPAEAPPELWGRAVRTAEQPSRTRRARRTHLSVAATVAALAAVAAAMVVAPSSTGPSSASVVLGRAAQALLDADPGPAPRPRQWVYTVSWTTNEPSKPAGRWNSWTRFDGNGFAEISPITHKLEVQTGEWEWPKGSPDQWYAVARGLPEEPDAVLQALRDDPLYTSDGATQADRDFDEVTSMLTTEAWLPPGIIARLYQALATIPGVGIDEDAAPDLGGRPVLSITYSGDLALGREGDRWELLLDPETYQVTGLRGTAGEDWSPDDEGPTYREGTVWYEHVVYERRLVDHAGDTR